jgi:hypothetical protein
LENLFGKKKMIRRRIDREGDADDAKKIRVKTEGGIMNCTRKRAEEGEGEGMITRTQFVPERNTDADYDDDASTITAESSNRRGTVDEVRVSRQNKKCKEGKDPIISNVLSIGNPTSSSVSRRYGLGDTYIIFSLSVNPSSAKSHPPLTS